MSRTRSGQRTLTAVVNYIGCSRVADNLESKYLSTYLAASVNNFTAADGKISGWTKKAGKGAGNVAFVSFHNAGHMVSLAMAGPSKADA